MGLLRDQIPLPVQSALESGASVVRPRLGSLRWRAQPIHALDEPLRRRHDPGAALLDQDLGLAHVARDLDLADGSDLGKPRGPHQPSDGPFEERVERKLLHVRHQPRRASEFLVHDPWPQLATSRVTVKCGLHSILRSVSTLRISWVVILRRAVSQSSTAARYWPSVTLPQTGRRPVDSP